MLLKSLKRYHGKSLHLLGNVLHAPSTENATLLAYPAPQALPY